MFLSRSRSLKIKKKCSRTSYNNLASRSGPYWSLYLTDYAMENTPSFSNTSAKMNFASSVFPIPWLTWILRPPIAVRRSPCLTAFGGYISCAVIQKRWYPKRNSKSFCWIINRHKWNGDYTHQLICFFRFPADVAKHYPHYIKLAFIVSRRLW